MCLYFSVILCLFGLFCFFFFFKQKTAYEMRISDWSSDVCSSDLGPAAVARSRPAGKRGLSALQLRRNRRRRLRCGDPAPSALEPASRCPAQGRSGAPCTRIVEAAGQFLGFANRAMGGRRLIPSGSDQSLRQGLRFSFVSSEVEASREAVIRGGDRDGPREWRSRARVVRPAWPAP